jgi:glycine cleavage system aminomethyltransferase T
MCRDQNFVSPTRFLGKARKEKGGFIGAETVLQQLKEGPSRRRVGLVVDGAPARRKSIPSDLSQPSRT